MTTSLAARVAICLALGVAGVSLAHADSIPYPTPGTPNPITYTFTASATGDVVAYFAGSTASYTESIGMLDNGVLTSAGFGLQDHSSSVGQSFDFGHVTQGDTLVFVLDVTSPNLGYVYSDPSMNTAYDINGTDGHNHVYSVPYTATSPAYPGIPVGTYVAFEDLPFPDSDFNYFDETYVFTNVNTQTNVLEPTSLVLAASWMLAFFAARGRRPLRMPEGL